MGNQLPADGEGLGVSMEAWVVCINTKVGVMYLMFGYCSKTYCLNQGGGLFMHGCWVCWGGRDS